VKLPASLLNFREIALNAVLAALHHRPSAISINLWGVVRNEEEKNAIRVAAEETPGVQAVNDHLRVCSS
jgi:hypothetical protein